MQENQEEDIDYNDIHALQAFVARVQQSLNTDNYEYDQYEESQRANPQDADWNPEMES